MPHGPYAQSSDSSLLTLIMNWQLDSTTLSKEISYLGREIEETHQQERSETTHVVPTARQPIVDSGCFACIWLQACLSCKCCSCTMPACPACGCKCASAGCDPTCPTCKSCCTAPRCPSSCSDCPCCTCCTCFGGRVEPAMTVLPAQEMMDKVQETVKSDQVEKKGGLQVRPP